MVFGKEELKKIYKPANDSSGEDNGQVTIIGGSQLFHGAPIFCLTVASRIVDMVFFATAEKSVGMIAESIKSKLFSFIWIPWDDLDKYIEKSDAILIGSGLMRYSETFGDDTYKSTKALTENLLSKFEEKKWVIDAGSLQTMDPKFIPKNSILTPNKKEFELLFNVKALISNVKSMAQKYKCLIVLKGPITYVSDGEKIVEVRGGNAGLTKGGTGDVQAGLTVALLAKNDPMLAACAASFIVKATADELQKTKGIYFNADDVANKIPSILFSATTAVN